MVKKSFNKIPRKYRIFLMSILAFTTICFISFTIYFKYYGVLPDPLANLLDEVPAPKSGDRILVFSPHPDDETIAAGGFIREAILKGAKVKIICITDGNKRKLKETRYGELKKVSGIIGVDEKNIKFYDFPDSKLKDYKSELYKKAKLDIDEFKPTITFSPLSEDSHLDHKATAETIDEIYSLPSYSKIIKYRYLVHFPYWPRPQGLYPTKHMLPPVKLMNAKYKWQKIYLDTDTLDNKTEAVLQYKSQLKMVLPRILLQSSIRRNELFVIE